MRFTVNQLEDSPLDQPSTLSFSYSDEDLDMSLPVTEPSPFSQKRELFSHLGEVDSRVDYIDSMNTAYNGCFSIDQHM